MSVTAFLIGAAVAAASPTGCDPRQLDHEFEGHPLPGVALVGGYVSGTLREKLVKQRRTEERATVELFPGDARPAKLQINHEDGLSAIVFQGHLRHDPGDELTARFGQPIRIAEFDGSYPTAYYPDRSTHEKWCDGQTVYILERKPDYYRLHVTTIRRPPWLRRWRL